MGSITGVAKMSLCHVLRCTGKVGIISTWICWKQVYHMFRLDWIMSDHYGLCEIWSS